MLKRVMVVASAVIAMFAVAVPLAHAQDDPLRGSSVTIRNTFERDGDGEQPFGEPDSATIGALIEFFPYGPYNVDLSSSAITFAWDSDPQWDEFERELEANFFDRYYLEFEDVVIESARADGDANLVPNVSIIDDSTVLVEFTEGMTVGDGQIARIALSVSAADGSEPEDSVQDEEETGEEETGDGSDPDGEEEYEAPEEEAPAEEYEEAASDDTASLPRTGLDAEAFGAGAIGLLTLGGALVVSRRRAARNTLSL